MSNQHTLYINHTPSGLDRQTDREREREGEKRGRERRTEWLADEPVIKCF